MPLIEISYLQLWRPFCELERGHLLNFGRWHYEGHFYVNIMILDQGLRRCRKTTFLFLDLVAILFGGADHLCNFSRKQYGEHLHEIIWTDGSRGDLF